MIILKTKDFNSLNRFNPIPVNCSLYHKLHKGAANTKLLGINQSFSCVVCDQLTTNQITFRDRRSQT